jgi:hypothetical protein
MATIDRQRLLAGLGALIGVAGIAFVVAKVVAEREQFAEAIRQADPGWLIASCMAGLLAIVGIAVNWIGIIRARGSVVPTVPGLHWFSVGQLGKYVPGGIWPVVGQAEMARRGGVGRGDAYAGTALSMATTLLGAALLAAMAGLASPEGRRVLGSALAAGLVAGAVCFAVGPIRRRLQAVVSKVTRGRLDVPTIADLARWTARHVPVWLAFSAANVFALIALGGPRDGGTMVDLAFATCVSWMAGFVIIGLPGGIGVRESVFVGLMSAPLGSALAVTVAVIGRLVSIVADLLAAGGSVIVDRGYDRDPCTDRSN